MTGTDFNTATSIYFVVGRYPRRALSWKLVTKNRKGLHSNANTIKPRHHETETVDISTLRGVHLVASFYTFGCVSAAKASF